MSAIRLIGAIEAAGCTIAVDGGEIVVRGARALPPELAAEVRQSKAKLLAALTAGLPAEAPLPLRKLHDDAWVLDPQRTCGSYVPCAERDGFEICGKLVVLGAALAHPHGGTFPGRPTAPTHHPTHASDGQSPHGSDQLAGPKASSRIA